MPQPHEVSLDVLRDPDELSLIRKLSDYPSVVQGSATALEPHRITFYLQELAGLLHTFYYKHRIMPVVVENDAADDRLVGADERAATPRESVTPELTAARLAMMRQVQQVLKNGLALLGISAPERM